MVLGKDVASHVKIHAETDGGFVGTFEPESAAPTQSAVV
jgi:hypothetical protein